ncbi:MAG TPA: hypothetical protein VII75_03870 [Thermoanaerobaculia bacterium]
MRKHVYTLAMFPLMVLAAGCAKNDRQPDRQHLRSTSVEMGNALTPVASNAPRIAAEGQMLYTLTATLPYGVVPDDTWQRPVLVDNTGARHRMITASMSNSSNGPSVFAATFEIPADRQPGLVEVGRYSIDFTHSLVTERKK